MSEVIELISEFDKLFSELADPDLDNALTNMVLLHTRIVSGDTIEPQKAARLLTLLSTYSAKFGMRATYYKTVGKMEKDSRRNMDIYKSASFHLDKLVDSIKYLAK